MLFVLDIYATVIEDSCDSPLKKDDTFEYFNLVPIFPRIKIFIRQGTVV